MAVKKNITKVSTCAGSREFIHLSVDNFPECESDKKKKQYQINDDDHHHHDTRQYIKEWEAKCLSFPSSYHNSSQPPPK